jgi:hypothetical protein
MLRKWSAARTVCGDDQNPNGVAEDQRTVLAVRD